jgi:hypothetical protein
MGVRRSPLTVTLLLAAALGVVVYLSQHNASTNDNRYWGYDFQTIEAREDIVFLSYKGGGETLEVTRIDNVEKSVADSVISDKVVMFKSLFEKQRIGYRGQHTEFIECPDRYKPKYYDKRLANGVLRYFQGFATARFAFGACNEEDVVYRAINAFLYCADTMTIFDIDYFFPITSDDSEDSVVDKFQCDR